MDRAELRTTGATILGEARALRAAFPDAGAMRALPVSPLPPESGGGPEEPGVRAALGYLRDEMLLVRDGKAGDLGVLDDEIGCVERLLARLAGAAPDATP